MSDTGEVQQFFLGGEIDDEVAGELISQLQDADSFDPTADWCIVICCDGGDIEGGTALYEIIRNYSVRGNGTHHITTEAHGKCCSMATLIAQAGDWRVTGDLTIWRFHHANTGCIGGTVPSVGREIVWVSEWETDADKAMLERTNMTLEEFRERIGYGEWSVRGPELLELGFVDEIR